MGRCRSCHRPRRLSSGAREGASGGSWVGAPLFSSSLCGAGLGAVSLYNSFKHYTCLPSDFPSYPGATIANYSFELNGTTPGSSCNMVFHLKDADRRFNPGEDSASVAFDFYQNQLSAGGWQVNASDAGSGHIAFRDVKRANTSGTVDLVAKVGYTEITIQLYSR
jgi:hypothetical protein